MQNFHLISTQRLSHVVGWEKKLFTCWDYCIRKKSRPIHGSMLVRAIYVILNKFTNLSTCNKFSFSFYGKMKLKYPLALLLHIAELCALQKLYHLTSVLRRKLLILKSDDAMRMNVSIYCEQISMQQQNN